MSENYTSNLEQLGKRAKQAAIVLSTASTNIKNTALSHIAEAISKNTNKILAANQKDIETARNAGLKQSFIDRLLLNEDRIRAMIKGVQSIIMHEDPVGHIDSGVTRPNGLRIIKARVPLGVIGIIYESRPNVTVDAAALCLKSGNSVILKGGDEAFHSNLCLVQIMREALEKSFLHSDCIIALEDISKERTLELMKLNQYVDVLIPRGGSGLIKTVVENSTVPIIETGAGNCHIYIDESADREMAIALTYNGKVSRPSVCNALETLLIHVNAAERILPGIKAALDESQVEWRGCAKTREILGDTITPATDDDYRTEFNDYILAVRVVNDIDEAIEHIRMYSTHHSECIVTESYRSTEKFISEIDAAAVYINASTRFTDGGEFGMGAEIGISTQKLHVRGPMGLTELTTNKYIVYGQGQTR